MNQDLNREPATGAPDCTECSPAPGTGPRAMSRRSMLQAGTALGLIGAAGSEAVLTRYAFAEPGPRSRVLNATPVPIEAAADVLVVLSLRGGFDGMSAVVPAADPDYVRLRPTVSIPASRLHRLDSTFGLHPALGPLMPYWRNGTLAFVQAVGQREATRSHFSAMSEMERAAPGTSLRTGWIDRMVGALGSASTFSATQLGGSSLPQALVGPNPELVVDAVDSFKISSAWNESEGARWNAALSALHETTPAAAAAPARSALAAVGTTSRLAQAGYRPAGGAVYPAGDLGSALRDVARLIKARIGLQVACVDYGAWDLHADMGGVDVGGMTSRLTELGTALAAFATDLGPTLSEVTLVTLSEFGRRVAENGSGGTDHGHGNAVLMLGGGVVGGRVHGRWPGLTDATLVDGDLPSLIDYRALLAEVLADRCGVGGVARVFPGLEWTPVGVTRSR